MVNMIHRKVRVNDGFGVSKVMTSTQDKKEDKEDIHNRQKFKDVELQVLLMMIRKHKNNSPSNWALVNKLFSIGYERWERFGRLVDAFHMIGKGKSVKTHVKFCSLCTKGCRFASYSYRG